MRLLLPVVVAMMSIGCASNSQMPRTEIAWQALHAVDIAQTLNAARDPCYVEVFPITQRLIGEQPSDAEVLAWGVGTALGHYLVTRGLERFNAPRWAQKAWGYTTVGHAAYNVAGNHSNGVRMFGDNQTVDGCHY